MKTTENNTVEFEGNKTISRTIWPVKRRLDFYPTFIPKQAMRFEGMVFRYMEEFCKPYSGGYWNFYALSNGGFYIGLKRSGLMQVENHLNYYKGEMSIDAASIGINLFALCDCASSGGQHLIDAFDQLRDYATIHPEREQILAFID
ncbi:antirestriction protein [Aquimarina macrocephali]|uniref:antirestriction protein n=1 Tax=Aquimarina macrocephali TaxID=666563 RepID=UPI000464293D|nr:antirestriction protein [Aquimarina macrocephali]